MSTTSGFRRCSNGQSTIPIGTTRSAAVDPTSPSRVSTAGVAPSGASQTGCAGGPCPAIRSSTACRTVRCGEPPAVRVTDPDACVVNGRTAGGAAWTVSPARPPSSSGPDTNAVWKQMRSPAPERRKPAPGVFGNSYASSVPSTVRDSEPDRVFRHTR